MERNTVSILLVEDDDIDAMRRIIEEKCIDENARLIHRRKPRFPLIQDRVVQAAQRIIDIVEGIVVRCTIPTM